MDLTSNEGHFGFEQKWLPHDDELCLICDQKSKGGRPKKISSRGRPTLIQQHLKSVTSSAVPEFNLSQVVDEASKSNMTCSSCHLAANRPVEIFPCKSLVCYKCCATFTSEAFVSCPGCFGRHECTPSLFSKPSPIIERMFNDVIVRCEGCGRNVQLEIVNKDCRKHHECNKVLFRNSELNSFLQWQSYI